MKKTFVLLTLMPISTIGPIALINTVQQENWSKNNQQLKHNLFFASLTPKQEKEFHYSNMMANSELIKNNNYFLWNKNIDDSNIVIDKIQNDFKSTIDYQKYQLNISKIEKNFQKRDQILNKYKITNFKNSVSSFKIKVFLQNHKFNLKIENNFYANIVDHEMIQNDIFNFTTNYFNIVDNSEMAYLTNLELQDIGNYLLFLKEFNPEIYVSFLDDLVKRVQYLRVINIVRVDPLVDYIKDVMWKDHEKQVRDEREPIFTGDSINGWNLVKNDYWNYFLKTIIFSSITTLLGQLARTTTKKSLIELILTISKSFLLKLQGFQRIGLILSSPILMKMITLSLAGYAIGKFINFLSFPNELVKAKTKEYVLDNKEKIIEMYGFETAKQFEEFMNEGFNIGFWSKWGSLFQIEAVKDRAYIIYDPTLNRNWVLNKINISSYAHFRSWLPWITYFRQNNVNVSINNNEKLFYTSLNSVKVPWVTTYHGPIKNPYQNYYVLETGINWLELSALAIKPDFIKLSLDSIKNRYAFETYKTFMAMKEIYQEGLDYIEDVKLRKHYKKMLELYEKTRKHENNHLNMYEKQIYLSYN